MKTSAINPTFKAVFKAFLKEFFPCNSFVQNIEECKTYQELNAVFVNHAESIAEELGVEIKSDCEECEGKGDEIRGLEEKIMEMETMGTGKLVDEMKMECFIENHHKFSLTDFQNLMQ